MKVTFCNGDCKNCNIKPRIVFQNYPEEIDEIAQVDFIDIDSLKSAKKKNLLSIVKR